MTHQEQFSEKELKILQERAARVRHPVENKRATSATSLVYIWLEQEVYAMPMTNLMTVHRNIPLIPVPCVPNFVAGVANIRGRVMPVIDLADLLNVNPSTQKSDDYVLVVAGVGVKEVVFRVNHIDDATNLADSSLKPLPDTLNISCPEFITGLLPDGTPLLNISAILDSPKLLVNESYEITIR